MHALHDLREMLCKELEEYGKKSELSAGALDTIDKLAHSIKNLDKVIEADEYSNYGGRSYRDDGGYSRGRSRDRMGRYYSRDGDVVDKLRKLADEAPDDMTRQEIHRLVTKMESM